MFGGKGSDLSKRHKMIYGMLNKFGDDGEWSTRFALRIGNYKFYNYEFETPTMKCEEGFRNERLKNKLIRTHGEEYYRQIMDDLNKQTSKTFKKRNLFSKGK